MHGFCMGGLYVYAASGLRPSNVPALRVCERVVATVIVSDEHNTPRGTEEHAKRRVEKLAGRCLRSVYAYVNVSLRARSCERPTVCDIEFRIWYRMPATAA